MKIFSLFAVLMVSCFAWSDGPSPVISATENCIHNGTFSVAERKAYAYGSWSGIQIQCNGEAAEKMIESLRDAGAVSRDSVYDGKVSSYFDLGNGTKGAPSPSYFVNSCIKTIQVRDGAPIAANCTLYLTADELMRFMQNVESGK